jgi:hypothetical protein
MNRPIVCPRCEVKQRFDVFVCPRCGRVELCIDGIGEEMRTTAPPAP